MKTFIVYIFYSEYTNRLQDEGGIFLKCLSVRKGYAKPAAFEFI